MGMFVVSRPLLNIVFLLFPWSAEVCCMFV